ncbi:MAG TPA: alpha/beta hydrolase [Candidatus Angelobacter sp.]|nr:alpha/beta hydrolase [Candidatus Angelobacter sp.]
MPSTIVLDPKTQWFLKYLESLGRPQIFEVPVAEAREMYAKGNALVPVVKQPAQIEDRTISIDPDSVSSTPVNTSSVGKSSGGAGSAGPSAIGSRNVKLRIFRPEGNINRLPVVMYFHGGGWVLGDADTYDYFMRELTSGSGAAVVFVEYSRSPEARYPVALEECYAATKWIAEHGAELNLNGARIAVAGDSAGGNLATAVCLLAARRKGPVIAAQVLIYPVTGHDFNSSSFEQFAKGYFLTREASQWFWKQYAPDESQSTACPMIATDDELQGMPPALIITGECDILRDEGEAYARKLMTARIPVTCTRYLGAIHGFMGINALADTPIVRTATAQVSQALRDALATSKNAMAAD